MVIFADVNASFSSYDIFQSIMPLSKNYASFPLNFIEFGIYVYRLLIKSIQTFDSSSCILNPTLCSASYIETKPSVT